LIEKLGLILLGFKIESEIMNVRVKIESVVFVVVLSGRFSGIWMKK
jgi:hypothetical protein